VRPEAILIVFLVSTLVAFTLPFALAPLHVPVTAFGLLLGALWLLPVTVLIAFRTPQLGGRRKPITSKQRGDMVRGSVLVGAMLMTGSFCSPWGPGPSSLGCAAST
jgi:hypothetical protein